MNKKFNLTVIFGVCAVLIAAQTFFCRAEDKKPEPYTAVIIGDSVNLRSGPGVSFEILRKADKGDTVLVLGEEY